MGCDIHATLEKQVDGEWVMVRRLSESKEWYGNNFCRRNYPRFAALAGVRGEGPKPKGLPDDISPSSKLLVDEWGSDGHSHSWDLLDDDLRSRLTQPGSMCEDEKVPKYFWDHFFGLDSWKPVGGKATEYRVVYFFDN